MWTKVIVGAVLLCSGVARADRQAQAHGIFTDNCARCHATEALRPRTSSRAADRLRAWMEHPAADSLCEANKLDPVQRELVMSLLRRTTDPMARSATPPKPASAKNGGLASRPEKAGPVLGQGDHR